MAQDLKILLSADLNLTDINATIKKLESKPLKLKLELDTSALNQLKLTMDTVSKGVSSSANNAIKNSVKDSTQEMRKMMKELQAEAARMQKELGFDSKAIGTSATKTQFTQNAKNQISGALVTYSDQVGQQITAKFDWVEKEIQGKMVKVFEYTGRSVTQNTARLTNELDKLQARAEKLKVALQSGQSKIFDSGQAANLVATYDKIIAEINKLKTTGESQSKSDLDGINKRIEANKQLTGEIQRQQREQVRTQNLGKTYLGSTGGLNLGSAGSEAQMKALVQSQLSTYLQGQNKSSKIDSKNVSIDSWATDPGTGQWVAKLSATVEDGKNKFTRYKVTVDEASNSIRLFGERILTTANRNLSFFDRLGVAMKNIPIWMVGMTAFYGTLHFFSDGVKYVNELNKSLTQLSIVFNQSQEEVSQYNKIFHDLAMQMSVTTEAVAAGAVEFARQGLSQTEMLEKMKVAVQYGAISNLDFNQSAKILTATVNSMGVTASHAADIFSYMGDATATGADEIGKAMQRVGGTAKTAQLPFEQLSSWIAVVSAKTREGSETIGNAFKSIIARYQSIKEKGFNEEDATNINQVTKALAQIGINATTSAGELRNIGEVVSELGGKWNQLTTKEQEYIGTTLAGTYQQSRFMNLMNGYSESVNLYKESLNKAGIAQEKFNRYQDSTQAHLDKLRTAWTGVFQDSFDSDGIRGIVTLLTSIATGIDAVVKNVGILPTTMALTAAAFILFNKSVRESTIGLNSFIPGVERLRQTMIASRATMETATGAMKAQATAMYLLAGAGRVLLSAFVPLLIITAVGFAIQKAVEAMSEASKKAEEYERRTKTIVSAVTEHKDVVEKLEKQYVALSEATNGGKVFQDEKQEQEYYKVMTDLSELMPNLVESIDSKGQAHLKNADAIKEEMKYAEKLANLEQQKRLASSGSDLKKSFDNYAKSVKTKNSLVKEASNPYDTKMMAMMAMGGGVPPLINKDEVQGIQDKENILNAEREAAVSANNIRNLLQTVANDTAQFNNLQIGDKLNKDFQKIFEAIDFDKFKNKPDEMGTLVQSIVINLSKIKTDGAEKSGEAIKRLQGDLERLGSKMSTDQIVKDLFDTGTAADSAAKKIVSYSDTVKSMGGSYKTAADELSILNGLLDDNAKGKRISADEVAKLIEKDAEMVDMFIVEGGQIKLNTQAIALKKEEMIKAFEVEAQKQREALINQNEALLKKIDMYETEVQGIGSVGDQLDLVNAKYDIMIANDEQSRHAAGIAGPSALFAEKSKATELIKNLDNLRKQTELYKSALNTVGQDKTEPKTQADVKPYDASNAKKYKIDIDQINAAIKGQEQYLTTLDKTSQQYRDGLEEEIVLQKRKQDAAHQNADDLRQQQATLEAQIAAMGEFNSLSNDDKTKHNDLRKQLDETVKSIDDMSNHWWDAYGKINSLTLEGVTSTFEEFDLKIKDVDDSLSQFKSEQGIYKEDSVQWIRSINDQNNAMREKQSLLHQEAELLRAQIAAGNLTAEQTRQLTEKVRGLSVEYNNLTAAITSNENAILQKRTEAANQIIQVYKDMYARQKQLMDEAYQKQMNDMDETHQKEINEIDEKQKAYERLISFKEKMLDRTNSETKYQAELAKKQREAQEISNKVDALAMDNSAEGKSQLKQLQKQLFDANTEIAQMQADHNAQMQKNALDDAKEQSQRETEVKKDQLNEDYKQKKHALEEEKKANDNAIQNMINDERTWNQIRKQMEEGHVSDVIAGLGKIDQNWETFVNTRAPLLMQNLKNNLFDGIKQELEDRQDQINQLAKSFEYLSSAQDIVNQMQRNSAAANNGGNVDKLHNENMDKLNQYNNLTGSGATYDPASGTYKLPNGQDLYDKTTIDTMKENSAKWFNAADGSASTMYTKAWYAAENQRLASQIGAYKGDDGNWYKNGVRLYHGGGLVGGGGNSTAQLINRMFNAAPNEQVIMALEDELMAPQNNIMKNFMPNMAGLVSNVSSKVASTNNGGTVVINIGSVTGDKKGADMVSKSIVNELKKLGKQF